MTVESGNDLGPNGLTGNDQSSAAVVAGGEDPFLGLEPTAENDALMRELIASSGLTPERERALTEMLDQRWSRMVARQVGK